MAIAAFTAARTLCELSGWSISNLHLQKMLYFAHMVYIGRNNKEPLIREAFEAWDYGPVIPVLYHEVKGYGANPIRRGLYNEERIFGSPEEAILKEAWENLSKKSVAQLIHATHWENGAWQKNFKRSVRGITIPNEDIFEEYKKRTSG